MTLRTSCIITVTAVVAAFLGQATAFVLAPPGTPAGKLALGKAKGHAPRAVALRMSVLCDQTWGTRASARGATSKLAARRVSASMTRSSASDDQPSAVGDQTNAVKDVLSGVVVALASVPTSIAFANIAGVPPLVGIWSSVIAGLFMSTLGASPALIAGAAGVVAVPLAPLIAQHGVVYMAPAVMLAAALVMLVVATRLSRAVSLVTDNIMKGFLNGLGCLLIKSQLAIFIALQGSPALPSSLAIAGLSGFITLSLPAIFTAVPSSLCAVVATTAMAQVLALPAPTLAQSFGAAPFSGGLASLPSIASLPFGAAAAATGAAAKTVPVSLDTLMIVAPVSISIALITVLETLLARKVVATQLESATTTAEDDQSLYALSSSNLVSCLFGGFGGCGLIPNTLLNLQSGGRGTLSGLSYAVALALFTLLAAPLIGSIPLASLAGVMLTVGISTVQPAATIDGAKAALSGAPGGVVDFVALIATGLVCYFVDMASGIGLGVAITLLGNKIKA
eukprot:Tamp_10313.p1 GENE.Tamp_10313~~Tamp_10313.p1  ORF type:complete len:530 (-),score=53.03 Tamp_10313:467-1990(-)